MSVRRGATLPDDGGVTLSSRLNLLLRLGEQNRTLALPLSPDSAEVGANAASAANAAEAVAGAPRRVSTLTFPTTQVEKVLQDKIRALEAEVQERNTALSRAMVELADVSKRARACAAQSAELRAKRADDAIEQAEFEEEYDRLREQVEWLQDRCDYVYVAEPPSLDTEPYGDAEPDPEREAAEERVRKGRARRERSRGWRGLLDPPTIMAAYE
jgi:hypothetical protein